jgi:hypothetical protein
MNEKDKCFGCLTSYQYYCDVKKQGYKDYCPCVNCLIKTVCTESCDEMKELIDSLDILK